MNRTVNLKIFVANSNVKFILKKKRAKFQWKHNSNCNSGCCVLVKFGSNSEIGNHFGKADIGTHDFIFAFFKKFQIFCILLQILPLDLTKYFDLKILNIEN
ncbi:hypothetical protein BpHYR1_001994 [Brachionus plicatilis]|uniref:Uncharacterized protein n=1 Tax=Brachionus plicatilis TaxID=10195 RepID=A0A3M7QSN9_BRAPC|nr:hypothetical protein BpHYR1_001994 [Brachionus plicatilis]